MMWLDLPPYEAKDLIMGFGFNKGFSNYDGPRYFLDFTNGADAPNSGRSHNAPWKTIAKLNNLSMKPGTRIFLKRGETWDISGAAALVFSGSGHGGRPIRIEAYGEGDRPIIDGVDAVNCISAISKNHLIIKDIETTQGLDSGFTFRTCKDIKVINCDAHDAGNDNLIFITGCARCHIQGGKFYAAYQREGGTTGSGIEIADSCHNITIDGAECYDQADGGMGITIHSHSDTRVPHHITLKNCYCHDNAGNGINILKQDNTEDSDRLILIDNCRSNGNTLDGIRVHKSAGATNYINGVDINNTRLHDNVRYGFYLWGDDLKMLRTIADGSQNIISASINASLRHCVLYLTSGGGSWRLWVQDARTAGLELKNNIIVSTAADGQMVYMGAGTTDGADIDNNLYYHPNTALNRWNWGGVAKNWAAWLADSSQDGNSPNPADPLFTNVGTDDFSLQAGSPAIDAGDDLGLAYLGSAPDCGYLEKA